jgi:subtilisin family serine protease/Tol biopolymer transport system component
MSSNGNETRRAKDRKGGRRNVDGGARRANGRIVAVALVAVLVLVGSGCTWIARQSVNSAGQEAHGNSDQAAVSADGRYVAFASDAGDLVSGDTNGRRDIFVRDNSTNAVSRVSVATDGTEADGNSSHPSISDDGRYVAFESEATNLAATDANGGVDVFVRDRTLNKTTLASPMLGATAASTGKALPTTGTPISAKQPRSVATPATIPDPSRPAADGTVRVIVRARGTVVPEAALSATAAAKQRADLGTGRQAVEQAITENGGQVVRSIDGQPFVSARIPAANVTALRSDESVRQVTPDYVVRPTDVSSNALVGSPIANAAGYDGTGTTVAILDSGIDTTHPFLTGRVVAQGCFTTSSTCPNGQGTQTGAGAAAPCPFNGCDHGTHVAGIVAGRRTAGGTYDGIAPGASIIAVQVFSLVDDCSCLGAYSSDLVAALQYVSSLRNTYKIAAVNMSLGSGPRFGPCDDDPAKPAIDDLRAAGIATLIASGNEGAADGIDSPGCISSAISVGATDQFDVPASFSNSSPDLGLLAPGVNVESSLPGGGFGSKSGTSMATPNVAGVWALFKQHVPTAGVSTVLTALRNTGRDVTDERNGIATTRVCAAAALGVGVCPNPDPPPPPPPPVNDDFSNASALVGDAGTIEGTNVGATVEPGEPSHLNSPRTASIWYKFTAPSNGVLSVDTFGTSFDTVMALYRGNSLSSLIQLDANDDSHQTLQSAVGPVRLVAGTTYRIAVADYDGGTGDVTVNWIFRQAFGDSTSPSISANGQLVAFASDVPSLISGDNNNVADVFVWDLGAKTTTRMSVTATGAGSNGPSSNPAISGNGGRVAFASAATNLVTKDTNGKTDVFVRSRTGNDNSIRRSSIATDGTPANGASDHPSLDTTGASIAFDSDATNLVASDANHASDVFVAPYASGPTERVSVKNNGGEGIGASSGPSISGDGRFVAFTSSAANLVTGDTKMVDDVFVRDRTDGTTRRVSSAQDDTEVDGPSTGGAISRDGAYVGFASEANQLVPGDGNGLSDVFLRRRQPVTITSVTPATAPRGASRTLIIRGTGFAAGIQVNVPDTNVTSVTITSSTQIGATIQVPAGATVGPRNVVVQMPGASWNLSAGANAICTSCVTLT